MSPSPAGGDLGGAAPTDQARPGALRWPRCAPTKKTRLTSLPRPPDGGPPRWVCSCSCRLIDAPRCASAPPRWRPRPGCYASMERPCSLVEAPDAPALPGRIMAIAPRPIGGTWGAAPRSVTPARNVSAWSMPAPRCAGHGAPDIGHAQELRADRGPALRRTCAADQTLRAGHGAPIDAHRWSAAGHAPRRCSE